MITKVNSLIDYYKDYIKKKHIIINNIYKNINNKETINKYYVKVASELNKLEDLSKTFKLYDSDYNDYMIAMGKFALAIEKLLDLNFDKMCEEDMLNSFVNIHERFEDLEQINIMKDVYVWKYISK